MICQKLRAFGYVSAYDCKNISEAIKYRDNFGQRELMVIFPDLPHGIAPPTANQPLMPRRGRWVCVPS
ncbi:major tail sheath domain protein [Proteus mirabilis]|nr:major tail sheath domain protein [Proteus mirabilis]